MTNKDKEIPLLNETKHIIQDKINTDVCVGDYNDLFRCIKSVFFDRKYLSAEFPLVKCRMNLSETVRFNYKSTACESLVSIGNQLLYQRKFVEAESFFLESLHYTIEKQEIIWTNLAIISLNCSNFIDAENRINKALLINNSNPNTLYTAGLIYEMLKDRNKAIIFYEKYLRVSNSKNKRQITEAKNRLYYLR